MKKACIRETMIILRVQVMGNTITRLVGYMLKKVKLGLDPNKKVINISRKRKVRVERNCKILRTIIICKCHTINKRRPCSIIME